MSKYDKVDRIDIGGAEGLKRLKEWQNSGKFSLEKDFKTALYEGVIQVQGDNLFIYFKQNGGTIYYEMIRLEKLVVRFYATFENEDVRFHDYIINREIQESMNLFDDDRILRDIFLTHTVTMHYMVNYERFVNSKRIYNNITKKGKGGNGKKVVKIGKTVYTVNVSKEAITEAKRDYQQHTSGFMVRGFWRTSKKGRRHWVNPYPKGDLRNIQPKEYKV
jgi:hypothetical protein